MGLVLVGIEVRRDDRKIHHNDNDNDIFDEKMEKTNHKKTNITKQTKIPVRQRPLTTIKDTRQGTHHPT